MGELVLSGLVVASEELDWLSAEAFQMFETGCPVTEGAAALLLERRDVVEKDEIELAQIAGPSLYRPESPGESFSQQCLRSGAKVRKEVEAAGLADSQSSLVTGRYGKGALHDAIEGEIWSDWAGNEVSPLSSTGAGFSVDAGWQCVIAAQLLKNAQAESAVISAIGGNQQAAAAVLRFGIE